jgi:hypothetical protein
MRRAAKIICILTVLICTSAYSCRPCDCVDCCVDPKPKKRMEFIFCDVTHSLNKSESDRVASMAVSILNGLPVETEYRIYPIQAETTQLAPINIDDEPVIHEKDKNADVQAALDKRRGEKLTQELAKLYKETNTDRRRDDMRTCILNAINFAGNQFQQFSADSYDRELIIVSDMLEECNDTPLGRPVNIHKHDITQEIELAKQFPQGTDLSGVRIIIITPITEDSYIKEDDGRRPPPNALKEFWGTIFSRCNVTPQNQKNLQLYLWSFGDLPKDILAHS